jgi:5-(aminomethyl)-3-furanmethanol phosphate kinase
MNATVIKIGGSLALHPEKLKVLCIKLGELSKKHRLIVIPGGGEFSDVVRDLDKRFSLSVSVSHRMAILGMDEYGLLLSDLIPNSTIVNKLEELEIFLSSSRLPIFLPSNLLLREDSLENSWDVTSDSITVYFASLLMVKKIVLITDVDGIYTDNPKIHPESKLIKQLSAHELFAMDKRTSVDKIVPKLLMKFPANCFIVNGLFPERVLAILDEQAAVCTLIKSGPSNSFFE